MFFLPVQVDEFYEFKQAQWNNDESNILTINTDGTTQLWDTTTQDKAFPFFINYGSVVQATWNKDKSFILTTGQDGTARVRNGNAMTEEEILIIPGTLRLTQAEWNPGGNRILTVSCSQSTRSLECLEGITRVWNVSPERRAVEATGIELPYFPPSVDSQDNVRWNMDGRRILTMGDEVTIWDAQKGTALLSLPGWWAMWDTDEDRMLTQCH